MGIKHIRTRAYRPQTNGKAERFIRTTLREWAYAARLRVSRFRPARDSFGSYLRCRPATRTLANRDPFVAPLTATVRP
jgi:transposase InsO family protein